MTGFKRLVPLILVALAVAFLAYRHQRDILEALHLLRVANPGFVLAALVCQCLYYAFAALTLNQCLRLVDYRLPFSTSLRSTFLLIFVNRIVPGPAATGPAAVYVILGRRGLARTKAAFVGPLFFAADYAAFFVLLTLGMLGALAGKQNVRAAAAAFPVLAVAIVVTVAALSVWRRPERLERFLTRWRGGVNRVLPSRVRIPENGPAVMAAEVAEMRDRMRAHPGIGGRLAAAAVAMLVCDVLTMACCFSAFGYVPSATTAVLGFCLATVGAIVSILPGGLGTFEMAMILGFAGLGAPKPVAVAATLVYRVLATWLPAVPGVLVSGELTASRE